MTQQYRVFRCVYTGIRGEIVRVCGSEGEGLSRDVAEVIGFTSCQVTGVRSSNSP